jgi:hypothetical protein
VNIQEAGITLSKLVTNVEASGQAIFHG